MDLVAHARRFAAEQQDIAAPKRVVEIRRPGARGEKDQTRAGPTAPSLECLPGWMTQDIHLIEIVHAGPPKGAVGGREARRLDDVRLDAEAGSETENGPRVLGNIGLEQRNAQVWGQARSRSGRPIF